MNEVALLQKKYGHYQNELPMSVVERLVELPQEAQVEFYEEYTRRSRSEVAGYLLHLFFGLRYGYLDKWVWQILAWLSWGIFGLGMLWWVVDLFRIPGLVKKHNRKVARNILKNVLLKYRRFRSTEIRSGGNARFQLGNKSRMTVHTPTHPREWVEMGDGMGGPSIGELKKGYYVVMNKDEQNWMVVYEGQYDWNDQQSEKEYKLLDDLDGSSFLFVARQKGQWKSFLTTPISPYSLHEHLEEEIYGRKRPFNVLEWEGTTYYRENEREGYFFDLEQRSTAPRPTKVWEYFDSSREKYLRIKQFDHKQLKAFVGKRLASYDTTILPDAMV